MNIDSKTLDNNSYATNPGKIKLNPLVWFINNKKDVGLLTLGLITSILFTLFISWWFSIVVSIFIVINRFYWLRKKEHFQHGASNLGTIISINPTLLAVATDLSKSNASYPAIKVIEYKTRKPVSLGDKVSTIALYTQVIDEESPYWIDFEPIPIDYATSNRIDLEGFLSRYTAEDIAEVDDWVRELETPYQLGLFKLYVAGNDW